MTLKITKKIIFLTILLNIKMNAVINMPTSAFPVNVDTVKSQLLSRLPDVLRYLYPAGKIRGSEFEIGDVNGKTGKSMKIALRGEKAGLWTDHAADDQGDILTLWAVTHNLCIKTQFPAVVKSAAEWLGISPPTNQEPTQQQVLPQEHQQSTLQTKPQIQEPQKIQYVYYAVDGSVIAHVNRHETDKGKGFRCFDVINQSHKVPDPKPLYNLPNVAQSEHIILCEGEKCADALISVGYCATTAIGGANTSIPKTDWSPLTGKHIWMWPDHDEAGYGYAERICEHLKTICASIMQLDPPTDKPPKWDAADAVFEGINIPEYIKAHTPCVEPIIPPFQAYKIGDLFDDIVN
jgi:putative DNA primase/helicase